MSSDPNVLIPQLLLAAGITPSEAEVKTLIAATPERQKMVNKLYAIPEARYEEPCLVFAATFPV